MNTPSNAYRYGTGIKLKLIISSLVLLLLALIFNTMLSLSSLEKIYIGSTFSKYSAIGNDLKRNIEKAMRFGKKIDKFIGMNAILKATRDHLQQDATVPAGPTVSLDMAGNLTVSLVLPNQKIRYSTAPERLGDILPQEVATHFATAFQHHDTNSPALENYYHFQDHYYIGIPIEQKRPPTLAATLVITIHESAIKAYIHQILSKKMKLMAAVSGGVLVLLAGFFFGVMPRGNLPCRFSRKQISMVILSILICAQILFSLLNTNDFKNCYLDISREKTAVVGSLLKEDIEYLLNKGIALDHLFAMEKMLGEIISSSPELKNITLLDAQNRPIYMADQNLVLALEKRKAPPETKVVEPKTAAVSAYHHIIPLTRTSPKDGVPVVEGKISMTLSKKTLWGEVLEILLDSLSVLIISLMFLTELLVIVFQYFSRSISTAPSSPARIDPSIIRPAAFLYFFGQTISVPFLPLYMETLYEPLWGLSKEVILGLPICTTMLFGGISPLIAGPWVDKRGWHESFLIGSVMTALGFVYTWMAPNAIHLIISRAFVGFGYGLTFMAANGFVVAHTDKDSKAHGLTRLIAGCYAGFICGSSTGGMLADRLGFNPVFLVGAIIIGISLIYTLIFLKSAMTSPRPGETDPDHAPAAATIPFRQLGDFLRHPRILFLCLFVILPSSMITVGFSNFFIPVYIDSIGSPPSHIGRLLMINGLFFIYIAPFFSKFIDTTTDKARYILLSGIITGTGLVLFYFIGGMPAAILSALILGLAGSLECPTPYALDLEATRKLGSAKAIAIFSSVEKIGQVIGPIVFGALILGGTDFRGLCLVGMVYAGATLLFYGINLQARKTEITATGGPKF